MSWFAVYNMEVGTTTLYKGQGFPTIQNTTLHCLDTVVTHNYVIYRLFTNQITFKTNIKVFYDDTNDLKCQISQPVTPAE